MRAVLSLLVAHPLRLAGSVALAAGMVLAGVGLLATSGDLIARAALHPDTVLALLVAVTGVRFFGLARAALRYVERLVSHDLTLRVLLGLRQRLYRHLLPLSPLGLGGDRSADLVGRLVEDVDELQVVGLRVVAPLLAGAIVSSVSVGLVALVSLRAAAMTAALLVVAGLGLPIALGGLGRLLGMREAVLRRERRVVLEDAVQGAQELWVYGQDAAFRRRLSAIDDALGMLASRRSRLEGLREGAGSFLALAAPWAVVVTALPQVTSGRLAALLLVPLALGVSGVFEAAEPLAEGLERWGRVQRAGDQVDEVLHRQPEVHDPSRPRPAPSAPILRAANVRFGYGEKSVLDGIDITLEAGKRVAVVGPSGSGKSTLVRLLVRFADPQAGVVTLGGEDLRALKQEDVRARIAVVPQRLWLYNASVRANLALACPGVADAALWRALEEAELADTVAALPAGLDTIVGEWGNRLSGGERQRLAIARALVKPAPLLLLDEPTAHLDTGTERRLLDALLRRRADRGVLLATHRIVGMDHVDEIVVLDGGRVRQRGSHRELASTAGVYRRLLDAQLGLAAEAAA